MIIPKTLEVTFKVEVDEDLYQECLDKGYSVKYINNMIGESIKYKNVYPSAPVQDIELLKIEVK